MNSEWCIVNQHRSVVCKREKHWAPVSFTLLYAAAYWVGREWRLMTIVCQLSKQQHSNNPASVTERERTDWAWCKPWQRDQEESWDLQSHYQTTKYWGISLWKHNIPQTSKRKKAQYYKCWNSFVYFVLCNTPDLKGFIRIYISERLMYHIRRSIS